MKIFLLSLFLIFTQTVYKETFDLKGNFSDQVHKGMNAYHNRYRTNDFYNFNVSKKPIFESEDSIIYRAKFITTANGNLLWDGKAKFINQGGKILCEVSELKILKHSKFMKGVDYVNVSVDEMEDTKGNRMNLEAIRNEVQKFFKNFK